ncbi:MAG: alpha/beta hydrolase [Fimbriimonadaceae bacterium]|nr:alpha/beta hydrolase [Fimbriimonadaceae bacterium]
MRFAALLLTLFVCTLSVAQTKDVTLTAADGKKVFGKYYKATGKVKGAVLMFHQARSNMEEYSNIAPRVAKLGYDCMTIDQRSGGEMWGVKNKTAAQYPASQNFLQAYADLEAAFNWAKTNKYKKIVAWGSSYSSSLALKLGAEHSEVSAVLAFSPGEYFGQKGLVGGWNSKMKARALFAFTKDEAIKGGIDLYDTAGNFPNRKYDVMAVHKDGLHGSSTLRKDKNTKSLEYYWTMVEEFLKNL